MAENAPKFLAHIVLSNWYSRYTTNKFEGKISETDTGRVICKHEWEERTVGFAKLFETIKVNRFYAEGEECRFYEKGWDGSKSIWIEATLYV